MFLICRLQELARKKRIPLYVYFIDLTKAYDCVDRTLLCTVLARFGMPRNMISVIRPFQYACGSTTGCGRDGLLWNRAFVKGACSCPYNSKYSLRRLQTWSTCVSKRTKTLWKVWCIIVRKGGGGREEATAREPVLATPRWGMLYADDAGNVLQSPKQLRKMMGGDRGCVRGVWSHLIGGQG